MALWELATPVFVGTFMVVVVTLMLMGKVQKLLRGPRRAMSWAFGVPLHTCSCRCKGCMRHKYKFHKRGTYGYGPARGHRQDSMKCGHSNGTPRTALVSKGRDAWVEIKKS